MPAPVDLTGQRFGRLVVVRRDETAPRGAGLHWVCRCDCGREAVVRSNLLRMGNTRSCGCLLSEHARSMRPKGPRRPPGAKAPDPRTLSIRAEFDAGGVTQADLARRHSVSRQRISQILERTRMPRPTEAPRLHALNPDAVAREVDDRLDHYLARLVVPLSPGLIVHAHRGGPSGIAMTAADLCRYAQGGPRAGGCDTHGEARDECQSLVECLWSRPADALSGGGDAGPIDERGGDPTADLDLDDPLSLVLVAGWARLTLCEPAVRGEDRLTARQLAALGSMAPRAVQNMATAGELRLTGDRPATATPREAKRFLESRGLKGL